MTRHRATIWHNVYYVSYGEASFCADHHIGNTRNRAHRLHLRWLQYGRPRRKFDAMRSARLVVLLLWPATVYAACARNVIPVPAINSIVFYWGATLRADQARFTIVGAAGSMAPTFESVSIDWKARRFIRYAPAIGGGYTPEQVVGEAYYEHVNPTRFDPGLPPISRAAQATWADRVLQIRRRDSTRAAVFCTNDKVLEAAYLDTVRISSNCDALQEGLLRHFRFENSADSERLTIANSQARFIFERRRLDPPTVRSNRLYFWRAAQCRRECASLRKNAPCQDVADKWLALNTRTILHRFTTETMEFQETVNLPGDRLEWELYYTCPQTLEGFLN